MYQLFKTKKTNLKEFLENISEEQIQNICAFKIYERGEDYYYDGAVEEIYFNNENKLSATISGQDEYSVIIEQENFAIIGQCSCPNDQGDVCKHIVAALIFTMNDYKKIALKTTDKKQNKSASSTGDFETYLNSLSKEELIRLVIDYAPKKFRTQIENIFLSESEADVLFRKISNSITKIFEDDKLLYSPNAFEGALVAKLDELRGIWAKKKDAISTLIMDLLEEIDDLQDEGYLYSDSYYGWGSEEYFEGNDLKNYLVDFIRHLPIEEKLNFIQKVAQLTESFNNDSTFCDLSNELQDLFTDSELSHLKQYYLSLVRGGNYYHEEAYYKRLSNEFSAEEKEFVLKKTSSASVVLSLDLARFYDEKGRIADAVAVLDRFIKKHRDSYNCPEDVFLLRLEFGTRQKEPRKKLFSLAKQGLSLHSDSEMLVSILSFLPEYDGQLEELLKTENPHEAFMYYESNNRLNEAVALIKAKRISEWEAYPFWCRHKQTFKQDAKKAFEERINSHLPEAKNRAYEVIADTLIQLRQIAPDDTAHWLQEIKTQYSRRRNLMQMLQKL